jgi:glutamyl-tRNA synthetase
MIELFSLEAINRAPSAFNTEKLLWLNQHYIKTLPVEELETQLQWHLQEQKLDVSQGPALADVINAQRERAKTLVGMVAISRYFYEEFADFDAAAVQKQFKADTADNLQTVHDTLAALPEWKGEPIHAAIQAACEKLGLKLGKVGPPLRVAVTGSASSPSLEITLELIGRERTLLRIQRAVSFIRNFTA